MERGRRRGVRRERDVTQGDLQVISDVKETEEEVSIGDC
jgi:hypothetical protein